MAESNPNAVVAELAGLKLFSDGSFYRYEPANVCVPPSPQASLPEDKGVASKDVMLDNDLGLWVRIYLPPMGNEQRRYPMPVCLYIHGGGFCIASASWKPFHEFCIRMAAAMGAIVLSVNYRLAPEHRLPAAYDDCDAALSWLLSGGGGDPWLRSHADLSKVFLIGDSAGGNAVHHVTLRKAPRLAGAVMVQPSFSGAERTPSEAESPKSSDESDMYRSLSLPVGASRDHPFCNPFADDLQSSALSEATLPPILIVVGGQDIRRDRERQYYQALKSSGKDIKLVEFEEEDHAFYVWKPEAKNTELLVQEIAQFVKKNSRHRL